MHGGLLNVKNLNYYFKISFSKLPDTLPIIITIIIIIFFILLFQTSLTVMMAQALIAFLTLITLSVMMAHVCAMLQDVMAIMTVAMGVTKVPVHVVSY